MHDVFIVGHALGGIAAFIVGALVLVPSVAQRRARGWLFTVFYMAVWLMLASMVTVILVDWSRLATAQQLMFAGLAVLGAYMAWRAERARRTLLSLPPGWQARYTNDVGFNLISLFDGFAIVAAIDLGAPGWLVGVIALLGVGIGIWAINTVTAQAA